MGMRILAGLAGAISLAACLSPETYRCDLEFCAGLDWEVNFSDYNYRKWDTLESATVGPLGLSVQFDPVHATAKVSAAAEADCASCSAFIVIDSAVLMADGPIVSPDGDTVPAGVNLLKQPWRDRVGSGDLHLHFHPGVRFLPGRHAFSMTAPWESKKTGRRVILSDTSHLAVP